MRWRGPAELSEAFGMPIEDVETLTEDARTAVLRVKTPHGDAIMKTSSLPGALSRAEAASRAGTALREVGYPAPDIWQIEDIAGEAMWLQRALPGTPGGFGSSHVAEAVRLNGCQEGLAAARFGRDWNVEVQGLLATHHGGGDPGMDRLWRLIDAALPTPACLRNSADLVHGDFHPGNFLFEGDAISGVADWDEAGFGSRAIDLAQLLCHLYDVGDDRSPASQVLVAAIVQCEGVAGLLTVVAAQTVRSALWGMQHQAGSAWSVDWGERVLRAVAASR